MRIGLVSQEYPPWTAHGGIASQTHLKSHGLARLGHEVHVITHSTDAERHEVLDGSVHVTRIPGFDARLPIATEAVRWLTYSALVASELSELHARTPLDLIDFPEWGGEGYVYLLNQTEWNRVPAVVHVHGPLAMLSETIGWPEPGSQLERVGREMEGTSLRLADAVLASSALSAGWCARAYGLDAGRIPVIHMGVDTRLFRKRTVERDTRPTVIFVGKVAPNKGAETLLEAATRLTRRHPDLRLRIIGRGEPGFLDDLRRRAEVANGLLELAGFVPHDALAEELSRADVFAAPAPHEGGPGLVYLEAMACELPVVACEGSGAAEVVAHGETGVLVPPDDPATLAEALDRLLSDRAARIAMAARARDQVVAEFSTEVCVRRLESIYRAVIAGRDPASVHPAAIGGSG